MYFYNAFFHNAVNRLFQKIVPQTKSKPSGSGFGLERRSNKMRALWLVKKVGANDMTFAPTWCG
ncbi:MAG: hypothetical protein DBY36_00140 [Clostridiales bacterium]|nr:MAG: hypothetical protein DBY36_00140 [Clostridiales bacterium]